MAPILSDSRETMIETGTGGSATVAEAVTMLEGLLEKSDGELEEALMPLRASSGSNR